MQTRVNLLFLMILLGCNIYKEPNNMDEIKSIQNNNISLLDRIRSNPAIRINGNNLNAKVYINGINSIYHQKEVLFVLDGLKVGNYSEVANLIGNSDIEAINILKEPSDLALYGFIGSGGVVLIKTK
tara:strand:- start:1791 stop:2171 length:381 start_codon:yes stop_codon:yes gene_type:complete